MAFNYIIVSPFKIISRFFTYTKQINIFLTEFINLLGEDAAYGAGGERVREILQDDANEHIEEHEGCEDGEAHEEDAGQHWAGADVRWVRLGALPRVVEIVDHEIVHDAIPALAGRHAEHDQQRVEEARVRAEVLQQAPELRGGDDATLPARRHCSGRSVCGHAQALEHWSQLRQVKHAIVVGIARTIAVVVFVIADFIETRTHCRVGIVAVPGADKSTVFVYIVGTVVFIRVTKRR